ncbi:MAG: ligase-associated DNA damage response endonuclease PdeM [Candidatus Puniceispirillaceae bacterium]
MTNKQVGILFHGQTFHLNGDGTLYWPDEATLIVSDMHLEKGAALSKGAPLPQFDTIDTLQRLNERLQIDKPQTLICLGDSFHSTERAFRLPPHYVSMISEIAEKTKIIWITGNHDAQLPNRLFGSAQDEFVKHNIRFCHEADGMPLRPTISGHLHPKARVKLRARRLSARCFVQSDLNLILPAFGSYTGGLNITDDAFSDHMSQQTKIHLIHDDMTYSLPYRPSVFQKDK